MLELESVTKAFNGAHSRALLRGLNLVVQPGEYVAIMGESGAGKSTLLNLIAGLDEPDSGRIVFGGQDVGALNDDQATRLRRRSMGFIFQAFHVLPHLSVSQNVALPLLLNGMDQCETRYRVDVMLAAVGLGGRGANLPGELSGGEMQRVAIARALVHKPMLLLADEPTGNLDADTAALILHLLRERIKADGDARAMGLLITHSARAAQSADRVLLLVEGALAPYRATSDQ